MKILGIDPGLSATGYGFLADGRYSRFGVIKTTPDQPLSQRIKSIVSELDNIIRREKPQACAVETLFFKVMGGARSVILSAHLRGALFYLLARHSIPIEEITPAKVKLMLTGNGRASKKQMQFMVKLILGIKEKVPEDAADALAVAYCLNKKLGN
jgi:crossover junction endodeoxyribonuclease RuvC